MIRSFWAWCSLLPAMIVCAAASPAMAQMPPGEPIRYPQTVSISITNPIDVSRTAEPVVIPLSEILRKAPNFNRNFYRIKRQAGDGFEPLDIPSQIQRVPGTGYGDELVFLVDLKPRERKVLELQYNPQGNTLPAYPARTQAFEKWYTGGVNIAWESEEIAYRSYGGLIDFFGKSYPHLRLQDLPPDSYHHEAAWGVDPFVIGKKPGLCGVSTIEGNSLVPWYGARDSVLYTHHAFGGGPVCAGAAVKVLNRGATVLEEVFTLYAGHRENYVQTLPVGGNRLIAVGMQKNDGETFTVDEKQGFAVSQARAGEYGVIGIVLVFDPVDFDGLVNREDGHFVRLKSSRDGKVRYLSLGAWNRVSAELPDTMDGLVKHARHLAQCFRNPLLVEVR